MLGYYIGNIQHTRVYKYLSYVGAGKNSSMIEAAQKVWGCRRTHICFYTLSKNIIFTMAQKASDRV